MSYNGSGTFQINTSGQPVVTGTSISSTVFNALTADLATGLSTAITKDGQTTTTAQIPFALGINSTLVTDATNTTSGSIITAGGVGIAKNVYVGSAVKFVGATSGSVGLQAKAVAGSTTFKLPSADGTSNQAMVTDGSGNLSFATIATTPGGSTTQVQYNNAGAFAGSANFNFDGTRLQLGTTSVINFGTQSIASNSVNDYQLSLTDTRGYSTSPYATIVFGGKYNTAGTYKVFGYVQGAKENTTDGNNAGFLALGTASNGGSETERARFSSNGNFLVNTTTITNTGQVCMDFNGVSAEGLTIKNTVNTTNSAFVQFYNSSATKIGSISNPTSSSIAYNTSSDYRLKNTIAPMTGALARVAALKPCTYKWNADGADGEGFIAHELAEVCPSAVTGEKDAVDADGNINPQGIDTSFLVATLTAAIQEQQALITQLTARITALEGAA